MSPAAAVVVIALMSSLTVSSMGFFPFASAFVNIVSPDKGEAVPAGSSLTISGTSDDNAQTNCNIQIIVNDNRPYQDTIPVAPGDYSEWTFVVNPQYAEIEEGINTTTFAECSWGNTITFASSTIFLANQIVRLAYNDFKYLASQ